MLDRLYSYLIYPVGSPRLCPAGVPLTTGVISLEYQLTRVDAGGNAETRASEESEPGVHDARVRTWTPAKRKSTRKVCAGAYIHYPIRKANRNKIATYEKYNITFVINALELTQNVDHQGI